MSVSLLTSSPAERGTERVGEILQENAALQWSRVCPHPQMGPETDRFGYVSSPIPLRCVE